MTGTIARIFSERGFGFISDGARTYFFHAQQLENRVFECVVVGDRVDFEWVDAPKGPRATSVSVIS